MIILNSGNSQSLRLAGISAITIDGNDFVDLPGSPFMADNSALASNTLDAGGYMSNSAKQILDLPCPGGYLVDDDDGIDLDDS